MISLGSASPSNPLERANESRTEAPRIDEVVKNCIESSLFEPAHLFLNRPRKKVRAHLVHAGLRMAEDSEIPETRFVRLQKAFISLERTLEAIHAGSLIIDDIQDNSTERRGGPCLHSTYGVPLAINAGNWLYFEPFSWIRRLGLPETMELELYRSYHKAMADAHLGQSIDLGLRVDDLRQDLVENVCLSSLRLKTGSLTSLALSAGAILGGATASRLSLIRDFGTRFGIALQMYDDVQNCRLPIGHSKRYEDFRLRRPSWVWASFANHASPREYAHFIKAVHALPQEDDLQLILESHESLGRATAEAHAFLDEAILSLESAGITQTAFPIASALIRELCQTIRGSNAE